MKNQEPKAYIFDLDGTLYLGEKVIPGAAKTLKWVRERGAQVRFVTNNPRYSRDFYADKLMNFGIDATIDEVMTSAKLAADYLQANPDYGSIFMIGEDQLYEELSSADLPVVTEGDPDTVLVSFDTTLTYEKLLVAYRALQAGAHFIATNPDVVCPTPEGGLVDAGAIIAALEAATGRTIEKVIGKPSSLMADLLIDQLKVKPEEIVVVGDRLNTDIYLAKKASMKGIWIRAHQEEIPENSPYHPDQMIKSIAELPAMIGNF